MRLVSPWKPRLADIAAPPSEQLVTALAEDILGGRLEDGARLPAHRDLAWKLGIGIGTVTKAYGILERRGLTRSVKGRGTFVVNDTSRIVSVIDFANNSPPTMLSERILAGTFSAVAKKLDPQLFTHYPSLGGCSEHRRLMSRWLARLGLDAAPSQLLLTGGAQQALALAFAMTCGPSGTLLTEELTYPGAIALARQAGLRVLGVAIDEEGIIPDALASALNACKGLPVALYVTPTMHNPTTATMSQGRRTEIVQVCRTYNTPIIEDDVYTLASAPGLSPLAMLAPERTFYINSLSKTLLPGLRIGVLVPPPGALDQAMRTLQAMALNVSPLACTVMEQWLADGTAGLVHESIRAEAARRRAQALAQLGNAAVHPDQEGFHVWLPMSRPHASQLAIEALAAGVSVTPPDAISVDPESSECGIRLCLGGAAPNDLARGLDVVSRLLAAFQSGIGHSSQGRRIPMA